MKRALAALLVVGCLGVRAIDAAPNKGASHLAARPIAETIEGVSPRALWQMANFLNPKWLKDPPTFVREGSGFTFRTSLAATHPETGEAIGVNVTWTIAMLDREKLDRSLDVPVDARFLVTGEFEYPAFHRRVETYTAILKRDGSLAGVPLGYKTADGYTIPDRSVPDEQVYTSLGIRPYTSRIVILPDEEGQ